MGQRLNKIKQPLFIGLFGGLIGSALTFYGTLYGVRRTFEYEQAHEVLVSTKLAISFLQNLNTEMDANANLLQLHDFKAQIVFGDVYNQADAMNAMIHTALTNPTNHMSTSDRDDLNKYEATVDLMLGPCVKVKTFDWPQEPLSSTVWDHASPELAEIDSELLRQLTQYYLAVHRLDATISALSATQAQPGGSVSLEFSERLKKLVALHNENVERVTQESVENLKEHMHTEIVRLHDLHKQFEDTP